MAKKKEEKKQNTEFRSFMEKTGQILKDERTHFALGLALMLFSVFLFISLLSFFFTGTADQSKLENLNAAQIVSVNNHIHNWGGSMGAWLSNFLINRWMGISSFALCLLFCIIGLRLMKVRQISVSKWVGYTFAFIILGSLICGFFFIDSYEDSFIYLGGQHGYYMTLLLQANIGWGGTLLVIIAGVLLFLIAVSSSTIIFLRKVFSYTPKIRKGEDENEAYESDPTDSVGPEPEDGCLLTTSETDEIQFHTDYGDTTDEEKEFSSEPFSIHPADSEFEVVFDQPRTEDVDQEEKQPEEHTFTVEKGQETAEEEDFRGEELEDYDPTLELSRYRSPGLDLMEKYDDSEHQIDMEEQNANQRRIAETLQNYGIRIKMIKATVGPTITLYEIIPEAGVRIAKIRNLEDDIALSLSALGIRIIAPIPGKGTIGIEVPNREAQIVSMRSVIASKKFQESKYDLPIVLGKTITNDVFTFDLCKMPHVLVAGATGQGKSVGLNAIITS
ncbi:MAG: DNA translocase FtsK 4TM domain-containing protein, partial [Coprobacter sp.]|nr:DNA translocase FtsK 4TM domain-containing protein [Coprobacter sp.]